MTTTKHGTHVPKNVKNIRKRYRADGTVRSYEVRYRDPVRLNRSGYPEVRAKNFKTLKAAKEWQARNAVDLLNGDHIDPDRLKTKWKHISEEWLEAKSATRRDRTINGYRNILNNWLSVWDDRPIDSLRPTDVREVLKALRREGRKVGTERHVFNCMNGVFKHAVKDGYIRKNPAEPVRDELRGQRESDYTGRALTAEQAERIIDALPKGRFRLYGLLGLWTGFRAGELAGLRVENLDAVRATVTVGETIQDLNGNLSPGMTKTRKSKGRRVPVPREVMAEVLAYVESEGLAADDYVFAGPNEHFRHANFYRRQWRAACKTADLVGVKFHTLRHTFLSLRAREGVPPNVLMEWAGHSSIKVTMDVYTHVYEDDPRDRDLIERMYAEGRQRTRGVKPDLRVVEEAS